MTNNAYLIAELLGAACAGFALGWIYYGGLWLTVRRVAHWRQPALGMLASIAIRLTLVATGLFILADGHWQRYLAALPGLLLARWWWTRRIQVNGLRR
ncbi:N-ATPase subunit AtpR [Methylomonas sp. MgM2]